MTTELDYHCPNCGNNLQNEKPADAPNLRRCASCKTIWNIREEKQDDYLTQLDRYFYGQDFSM